MTKTSQQWSKLYRSTPPPADRTHRRFVVFSAQGSFTLTHSQLYRTHNSEKTSSQTLKGLNEWMNGRMKLPTLVWKKL